MNCNCGWNYESASGSMHHSHFRCPLCGAVMHELGPNEDGFSLSGSKRIASVQRLLLAAGRSARSTRRSWRSRQSTLMAAVAMVLGVMACLGCLDRGDLARLSVGSTAMLAVALGALGLRTTNHGRRRQVMPAAALITAVLAAGLTCLPFETWTPKPSPLRRSLSELNADPDTQFPSATFPARLIEASEWTMAPRPAQRSIMQVRVLSAHVAQDPDIEDADTSSALLLVVLEFTNTSNTRVYRYYKDWSVLNAKMKDNFGNSYTLYRKSAEQDAGGPCVPAAVYPGKAYRTRFVFEPPVPRARDLFLELPAECLGGSDPVRIRIPVRLMNEGTRDLQDIEPPELPGKNESRGLHAIPEPGARIAVRAPG